MEEKYWIWISRIKGIGNRIITNLIEMYGNLENVWNLDYAKFYYAQLKKLDI